MSEITTIPTGRGAAIGMDYDIIVVGAGPAGLSAAVRAAWLAAPSASYKARVLVLEASDQAGGLSRWQPLVINTPGVFFTKRELRALLAAGEHFGVEMRFERVLSLRQVNEGMFEVQTAAGCYRTVAAIVATGCRLGHPGESRLFHRKRILWFHGNEHLRQLIDQLDADERIRSVCLAGAEGVAATRRFIGATSSLDIHTWAEPPCSGDIPSDVECGRLVQLRVDPEQPRLQLGFERPDESIVAFAADVLIVDFNAYEARATSVGFLEVGARRQANGFLDPDRAMATGTPGLFSAGDVNGVPFCVAKAMSDGIVAGYSAYEYVCLRRTGERPNLFPYYPYRV